MEEYKSECHHVTVIGTQDTIVGKRGAGDKPASQCGCLSNSSTAPSSDMSVSMPICFLVREQAKSVVAIQDLQKRLENLEGLQGDVISAITEVHDYLSSDADDVFDETTQPKPFSVSLSPRRKKPTMVSADKMHCLHSKKQLSSSLPHRYIQEDTVSSSVRPKMKHVSPTLKLSYCDSKKNLEVSLRHETAQKILDLVKTKDSALESDKQDSGLDSDCRDQGQETSYLPNTVIMSKQPPGTTREDDSDDELLELLNEIGHKGQALQKQLAVIEENTTVSDDLNLEMSKLQMERLGLQHLLSDVKEERDELKIKLDKLESTSDELSCQKRNLEEKLLSALAEKQQLEARIHDLHIQFIKGTKSDSHSPEMLDSQQTVCKTDIPKSNRRFILKDNRAKVSSILKETNIVELQRQLLVYLLENEVLQTKIAQTEQILITKTIECEQVEKALRDEVRHFMQENQELHITLEEQKLELTALKSKVRMLERVLRAVTLENRELNWQLGESLGLGAVLQDTRNQNQAFPSPDTAAFLPDVAKGRRYSLPSKLAPQRDISVTCTKSRLLPNTSSFIDVTINEHDSEHEKCTLSSIKPNSVPHQMHRRATHLSSTPVLSYKQQQHQFSDPVLPSAVKHTCSPYFSTSLSHQHLIKKLLKTSLNNESPCTHDIEQPSKVDSVHISPLNHSELTQNLKCSSDTFVKQNINECISKPLESVKERNISNPTSNTTPLNSLSTKYKVFRSNYKTNDVNQQEETCSVADSASDILQNISKSSVSNLKISPVSHHSNSNQCNMTSETDQSQLLAEQVPRNSRNIHRQIQNFLDRITAGSNEAMV